MAEHFCKEHDVAFTAKTGKDGDVFWSHQTDEGWCNEAKEKKPAAKKTTESPERQASIEIQNAYTGIPALVEALATHPDDKLLRTAYNYAMSRLANWASMGDPLESEPVPGTEEDVEKPTTKQRNRLSAALKKWDAEKAKELLIERWHTNETKHLSKGQMEDFINELNKPDKLEPEDIPF